MLKKSKVISFKLSSAELGQIKSMPGPAGKHLEATNESESAGSSLPGEPGGVLVQGRPGVQGSARLARGEGENVGVRAVLPRQRLPLIACR